ncbi:MAG: peptidyl-prolyl cis-trans isomerase [Deltaproteobacteria bacterium]|nr:peptidyl-prolyl cis-trans isomerase [Deltaproteobacteria bacterium]MCB9788583.1 peptidyl-prolyl cis-trans isomerase [Deltaproteobacteria bacterium]
MRQPLAWVQRWPLLCFFALGAAMLGARGLWRAGLPAARTPLVVQAPAEASDAEVRRRVDEAILVEEGLALGWAATDPVIVDRLVRNLRFVGQTGDSDALLARALSWGMARSDLVVRQRLVSRAERLLERSADRVPPTDAELRAHLAAHPERFARAARVRFDQIHLSRDRRGADLEARARALRARLDAAPADRLDPSLGDFLATARPGRSATEQELARDYGAPFASAVLAAPVGATIGPLSSPFGLHFVRVLERRSASTPPLAAVRAAVLDSLLHERRDQRRRELMAELRQRYELVVRRAPVELATAPAAAPAALAVSP